LGPGWRGRPQRLAAAGGHQDKRIVPAHYCGDDFLLLRQKGVETEVGLQQVKHG
jgi:hypothetical protein